MNYRTASIALLLGTSLLGLTGCPGHVVCRSCKVDKGNLIWNVEALQDGESLEMMRVTLSNEGGKETIEYPKPALQSPSPAVYDERLCTVDPTQAAPTAAIVELVVRSATGESTTVESELGIGEACP